MSEQRNEVVSVRLGQDEVWSQGHADPLADILRVADVLADQGQIQLVKQLNGARAAVAELIDRADYLCRTGEGMIAFRAALARCKGEGA